MTESIVMTVRGPVPASSLGITLMHEHILLNLLREYRHDGWLNDVPLAVEELRRFQTMGGTSLVDMTNGGLDRQPKAIRWISEQTGLNVIMGCGWYRHQYYDADLIDRSSTNELTEQIVRELTEGIDGTDICAGIIGEIGCDEWITAQEERVFRAAARAHKQTGVSISTHAARWPVGAKQLDLFVEEGVDLRRVIIGHSDTVASANWYSRSDLLAYHEALARRGAYVQFDTLYRKSEYELQNRITYIKNLIAKGFSDRILLSHDVAMRSALRAYGGGGYDFLLTDFVPQLEAAGVATDAIHQILVDNPRRALTIS